MSTVATMSMVWYVESVCMYPERLVNVAYTSCIRVPPHPNVYAYERVNAVTCLHYAECPRAPGYIISGYGYPMQTISAHGATSRPYLSARTQPPMTTGAPSQTSTIPYHAIPHLSIPLPYHAMPCAPMSTTCMWPANPHWRTHCCGQISLCGCLICWVIINV